MITKMMSVVTGGSLALLSVANVSDNAGFLPYFASNIPLLVAGKLIVALILIGLTFKKTFSSFWGYGVCAIMATTLLLAGLAGFTNFSYEASAYLGPLDFIVFLEMGCIAGITALSLPHPRSSFSLAKLKNTWGLIQHLGYGHSTLHSTKARSI